MKALKDTMLKGLVFAMVLAGCSISQELQPAVVTVQVSYTPEVPITATPIVTAIPTVSLTSIERLVSTKEPTLVPTQTLSSVAWSDLQLFLAQDHTNWNVWKCPEYTCNNFTNDLINNSILRGIPAGAVALFWSEFEIGHAFVWFDTIEYGRVYVEPQTDYTYLIPKTGDKLCLFVDTSWCWKGTVEEIIEYPQGPASLRGVPIQLCPSL